MDDVAVVVGADPARKVVILQLHDRQEKELWRKEMQPLEAFALADTLERGKDTSNITAFLAEWWGLGFKFDSTTRTSLVTWLRAAATANTSGRA